MGDFIYSKAFMLMMKLDRPTILKELAEATNDIARGEIIQLNLFENYRNLSLKDLLKVSYLKTGRLFEAASKTGAMLANSSETEVRNFGSLGKTLGIAFQIQDDILDYDSLHKNTGKPALQDFQEGKITFPLFYALKHSAEDDRQFLLEHLGNKRLTKTMQNRVCSLVRSKMAAQSSQMLLDSHISKAKRSLAKLNHHSSYNEMLNLVMFSNQRES
jgi:octaprenyl-diphosphate synthase